MFVCVCGCYFWKNKKSFFRNVVMYKHSSVNTYTYLYLYTIQVEVITRTFPPQSTLLYNNKTYVCMCVWKKKKIWSSELLKKKQPNWNSFYEYVMIIISMIHLKKKMKKCNDPFWLNKIGLIIIFNFKLGV